VIVARASRLPWTLMQPRRPHHKEASPLRSPHQSLDQIEVVADEALLFAPIHWGEVVNFEPVDLPIAVVGGSACGLGGQEEEIVRRLPDGFFTGQAFARS